MKTFPSTSAQIPLRLRKKRPPKQVPNEVHQIVHSLFNQLSVINLCSFKLCGSLRNSAVPAISDDIEILERAVQDATTMAEQLSQAIAEPAPLVATQAVYLVKSTHQTNNVLPLFAPRRQR
jgi:hypothetical protein